MKKYFLWSAMLLACLLGHAQVALRWAATYNGQGDFNDRITCTVSDAAGNLYLGGATTVANANSDYWVLKIDAAGDTVWTWHMDGAGNGQDEVLAIAVNASGNVAVTGLSKSPDFGDDALTVLLDPNGAPLWTAIYNNSFGNEDDLGVSVAFVPSGGVVVCGYGDRDPTVSTNNDYFTIQYDANGQQSWRQTYNGAGLDSDRPADLAVDASGNVYVTGRSDNGNDDDYLTIKYDATGVQQWVRLVDMGGTDRATCIGLDPSGNVFVSGRSDTGNDDDFYTVKYDPAGTILWTRSLNHVDDDRAIALVTDALGAVYITGQSDANLSNLRNWDYLTVKYTETGTLAWSQRYNSPLSQHDFPTSIALDGNGDVYVTGYSAVDTFAASTLNDIATTAYEGFAGTPLWASIYAGSALLNDVGNAVVGTAAGCIVSGFRSTTSSQMDGLTLNYNGSGNLNWEKHYLGLGDNNDNVNALAVDALGNVYAAGYQVQNGQDRDIALWKLTGTGGTTCSKAYSGTSTPSPDVCQGIALDATGNPSIAGYVKNTNESYALWWAKYLPTCDTQYTRKYNATVQGSDKTYDMVGDGQGNIYITGKVDADANYALVNDNCYTAKINAAGTVVWSRTYASAGSNEDRGSKIVLSAAGNTYVVGRSLISGNYDLFLVKYDALGVQQWVQTWSGNFGNDEPYDLEVDAAENVYITGRTEETMIGQFDYLTLKYMGGALAWARTYDGVGAGDDQAQALAVDGVGNVYVTGRADVDATASEDLDMVTLKYDAVGTLSWAHTLGDTADDHADDIAVSPAGNIYITGHVNKGSLAASNFDVMTYILDPSASVLWQDSFDGPAQEDDVPSILLLQGNEIYIGGSSGNGAEQKNMLVLNYGGAVSVAAPEFWADVTIFPNPAQSEFTVRNMGKPMKDAQLSLMDETGRLLREIRLMNSGETQVTLEALPAGLYLYKIVQSGKMVARGKIAHF